MLAGITYGIFKLSVPCTTRASESGTVEVVPMEHLLSKSTLLKLRSGRTALSPPTILPGGSTLTTTISWERVQALGVGSLEGSLAPSILALRSEYEIWEVPRNMKKSVSRQLHAEVQGAQVDGVEGVAYPREGKLLKYVAAALSLMEDPLVTQKQLQVVCGGLVYFSMFRRPLLGCLNGVWQFIE